MSTLFVVIVVFSVRSSHFFDGPRRAALRPLTSFSSDLSWLLRFCHQHSPHLLSEEHIHIWSSILTHTETVLNCFQTFTLQSPSSSHFRLNRRQWCLAVLQDDRLWLAKQDSMSVNHCSRQLQTMLPLDSLDVSTLIVLSMISRVERTVFCVLQTVCPETTTTRRHHQAIRHLFQRHSELENECVERLNSQRATDRDQLRNARLDDFDPKQVALPTLPATIRRKKPSRVQYQPFELQRLMAQNVKDVQDHWSVLQTQTTLDLSLLTKVKRVWSSIQADWSHRMSALQVDCQWTTLTDFGRAPSQHAMTDSILSHRCGLMKRFYQLILTDKQPKTTLLKILCKSMPQRSKIRTFNTSLLSTFKAEPDVEELFMEWFLCSITGGYDHASVTVSPQRLQELYGFLYQQASPTARQSAWAVLHRLVRSVLTRHKFLSVFVVREFLVWSLHTDLILEATFHQQLLSIQFHYRRFRAVIISVMDRLRHTINVFGWPALLARTEDVSPGRRLLSNRVDQRQLLAWLGVLPRAGDSQVVAVYLEQCRRRLCRAQDVLRHVRPVRHSSMAWLGSLMNLGHRLINLKKPRPVHLPTHLLKQWLLVDEDDHPFPGEQKRCWPSRWKKTTFQYRFRPVSLHQLQLMTTASFQSRTSCRRPKTSTRHTKHLLLGRFILNPMPDVRRSTPSTIHVRLKAFTSVLSRNIFKTICQQRGHVPNSLSFIDQGQDSITNNFFKINSQNLLLTAFGPHTEVHVPYLFHTQAEFGRPTGSLTTNQQQTMYRWLARSIALSRHWNWSQQWPQFFKLLPAFGMSTKMVRSCLLLQNDIWNGSFTAKSLSVELSLYQDLYPHSFQVLKTLTYLSQRLQASNIHRLPRKFTTTIVRRFKRIKPPSSLCRISCTFCRLCGTVFTPVVGLSSTITTSVARFQAGSPRRHSAEGIVAQCPAHTNNHLLSSPIATTTVNLIGQILLLGPIHLFPTTCNLLATNFTTDNDDEDDESGHRLRAIIERPTHMANATNVRWAIFVCCRCLRLAIVKQDTKALMSGLLCHECASQVASLHKRIQTTLAMRRLQVVFLMHLHVILPTHRHLQTHWTMLDIDELEDELAHEDQVVENLVHDQMPLIWIRYLQHHYDRHQQLSLPKPLVNLLHTHHSLACPSFQSCPGLSYHFNPVKTI